MTAQPATLTRQLHVPGWSLCPPPRQEHAPEVESWLDYSEVYENLRLELRALKRRALIYAEQQGWNPLYWFRPRRCDWPGVILLAQSGDLALRIVDGQRRYRITSQGRLTLDTMRFTRA